MLYAIHRYPTQLVDVLRLADGRQVTIRPILPQDAAIEQAFIAALSPAARYDRFLGPMRQLPASVLDAFTHVDYRSHLALIAEHFSGGVETIVADARYVARPDEPRAAEMAVAVADGWRGAGLASRLLGRLERSAAEAGFNRLTGETLATNDAMVGLARKHGYAVRRNPAAPTLLSLDKDLSPARPSKGDDPNRSRDAA